MSLDIDLVIKSNHECPCGKGFVTFKENVCSLNITHNLATMARKADLYEIIWRPDELYQKPRARHLIQKLSAGMQRLEENTEYYKKFNPKNKWGTYEGFVYFVRRLLLKCKKYPQAYIEVSR